MGNEVRMIDAYEAMLNTYSEVYWTASEAAAVRSFLVRQTTFDPESLRPKGRWEPMGETDYKCSVCGFRFTSGDPIEMFPYCRCGAKMEVAE